MLLAVWLSYFEVKALKRAFQKFSAAIQDSPVRCEGRHMMITRNTVVWFLLILLFLFTFGCGSGSEKDTIYICQESTDYWVSNSGTIAADLHANHFLCAFDIDFYTIFDNYIKTITEADIVSYSGTMNISSISADQDYSLAGSVNLTGNWYLIFSDASDSYTKGSVSWADSTSGTVVLDGFPSPFTASGDQLSITYPMSPMSCFLLEETPDPAIGGTP